MNREGGGGGEWGEGGRTMTEVGHAPGEYTGGGGGGRGEGEGGRGHRQMNVRREGRHT